MKARKKSDVEVWVWNESYETLREVQRKANFSYGSTGHQDRPDLCQALMVTIRLDLYTTSVRVNPGDYLIAEFGRLYVCSPELFHQLYEIVS